MAVRPGYKQTEVGVIPGDWNARKLSELASFRTGPFGSALHKSDYTNDGVPIVNPMHINDGRIEPTRSMTVTESAAAALSDFRLAAGEVIIGRRGDMGRCAVVRAEHSGWLCGTGSMIVRPTTTVDAEFLQRILSSHTVISAIENSSVGSTMINLNQGTLGGLVIQTPPFPEQRAIATALSDVDALLAKLDALVAKKRDLKVAAMQQLLTGQTRLPGFSGEWEVKPFGEVLFRVNGKVHQIQSSDYQETGDHPVVDQGKELVIGFSDHADKVFHCPNGGVIVFGDHTCIVKFVDFDFVVGADGTQIMAGKNGQSARFHAYQLEYAGIPNTGYNRHFKFVREREFISPILAEQTAIATVLSDMDAELTALEARRDKTRTLKQGMMQELLTGRIRLLTTTPQPLGDGLGSANC